ncbi:hypothetical protein SUNDANCE_142 [Brevibacillus phage Sundance]|uniref:hypothetical protein n=1 Tax=Brevibacillus phage Sundance TaxID=1691958 RepID=UPI0006BCCCC1|nr:hypothetical protein AVT09_gp142 [Brevibacillus phage Sundance]ALA47958.1 hypothetical protein SUNDANCE_142 [Brevibacillus phage Sundance]
MFKWLYQKEEHLTRLFGTKWYSPLSIKWFHRFPHWGIQLREGYVDIYIGRLGIRIRQTALPFK